jgi:Holliday junction resolvasome RuvABC endonuclease subunit
MVSMLLPTAKLQDEHATDALAIAITLAHAGDFSGRLEAALRKSESAQVLQ